MSESDAKTCTKCKEPKPKTAYYKNRSRKDGLNSRCKICEEVAKKTRRQNIASERASDTVRVHKGISSEHIGSILYEIGRLELSLRGERAARNKKIIQIKEQSDYLIQKMMKQQAGLFDSLDKYVQDRFIESELFVKEYPYGRLRVVSGTAVIEPFLDKVGIAVKRMSEGSKIQ